MMSERPLHLAPGELRYLQSQRTPRGSFLSDGEPQQHLTEIRDPSTNRRHCKKLIEVCGDGGGFILGSGCEIASDAPFANIQALVNAGKKYGPYRK